MGYVWLGHFYFLNTNSWRIIINNFHHHSLLRLSYPSLFCFCFLIKLMGKAWNSFPNQIELGHSTVPEIARPTAADVACWGSHCLLPLYKRKNQVLFFADGWKVAGQRQCRRRTFYGCIRRLSWLSAISMVQKEAMFSIEVGLFHRVLYYSSSQSQATDSSKQPSRE